MHPQSQIEVISRFMNSCKSKMAGTEADQRAVHASAELCAAEWMNQQSFAPGQVACEMWLDDQPLPRGVEWVGLSSEQPWMSCG